MEQSQISPVTPAEVSLDQPAPTQSLFKSVSPTRSAEPSGGSPKDHGPLKHEQQTLLIIGH